MKRILIFLCCIAVVETIDATNVSVDQPGSICINAGPITLVAHATDTIGPVQYRWQIKLSEQWTTIADSVRSQLVVTDFAGSTGTYRCFINNNGCQYYSDQVCLYKCGPLAIEVAAFSGSVSDKDVLLQFSIEGDGKVFLESSFDQRVWSVVEVTGTHSYVDNQFVGTKYYRLKLVDNSGTVYSKVIHLSLYDPSKPLIISVTTLDGRKVLENKKTSYWNINQAVAEYGTQFQQGGIYILSFFQNGELIQRKQFLKTY